ncbi:glycosyltransferase family 39 protein [Streptacidiphilus melanogenes]|uniref:glycosyltransferase family 39 protein n=1 Tax=Streptacidiphilus melanogenes TaxID=411235 RepID=UPI0006933E58|nr:glycosyltransferase family 39 protein [Streptacidiphilus melanogenes]
MTPESEDGWFTPARAHQIPPQSQPVQQREYAARPAPAAGYASEAPAQDPYLAIGTESSAGSMAGDEYMWTHPEEEPLYPVSESEPEPEPLDENDAEDRGATGGAARAWRTAALLLVPSAVTLVVAGYQLGHRQLWQDESASWWAATLSWSQLLHLLGNIDIVLAPYYALMHLWISVAGTSVVALRIPSLAAMGLSAGLLALLGRRMFNSRVGMVAGLIFAVLPATSRYGQEARPYALTVLAVLAATLLLYRALDDPRADRWGGYALSLPFTGMFHLVAALVLAAHLVLVLVVARKRWGAWAAVVGFCVVPVLLIALLGHGQSAQVSWISTDLKDLPQFPGQFFLSTDGMYVTVGAALLGLLFARRYSFVLLTWALVPPVLLFLSRSVLNLFLPRYLLFTLPAWALLAAVGVCGLAGLAGPRRKGLVARQLVAGVALVGALVAVCLPDQRAVRVNPLAGQPDFQSAAAWLLHHQQPGDGVAFAGTRGVPIRTMAYAMRGSSAQPSDVFLAQSPAASGTYEGKPCAVPATCAVGVQRIWLVSTSTTASFYDGLPDKQRAVLTQQFRVVSEQRFTGELRVVLLERRPARVKPPTVKPPTVKKARTAAKR